MGIFTFRSQERERGSEETIQTEPKDVNALTDDSHISGQSLHDQYPLAGLSLQDKKCVLINHELDSHGMAKYQWCIWGLCGFGYMLDLLWAQTFGLVLSPIKQEYGFGNDKSGNISIAFSSGMTAGAFIWGVLVDIVGRHWAFNLTVLFSSVFGLCLAIPSSYTPFLVLTAFTGFGVGGNIPIDTTICLEFIPQNRRFLLALLSIFQPIGVVLCSAIAYAYIPVYGCKPDFTKPDTALPSCQNVPAGQPCCGKSDNMGWRYLLYTIGGITLFVFFTRFVLFKFQESPKFLVSKGKDNKALKSLANICKFNKRKCTVTAATFAQLEREHQELAGAGEMDNKSDERLLGGMYSQDWKKRVWAEFTKLGLLFHSWQMTHLTILIWLTYACDYWGFSVAGTYLPTILALKNGAIDVSLRSTYRSYIYIYLPGIIGVVVGSMMYRVPFLGRKYTMVIASGLMGASIFIFSAVNTEASNIGVNVMEYFFQSMFNSVLYGWTPESFPAAVRGTASGVASFWGRLFGIIGPIIAQNLYARSQNGGGDINAVLYLAGGVTLGCVITTLLLPNQKLGKQSL